MYYKSYAPAKRNKTNAVTKIHSYKTNPFHFLETNVNDIIMTILYIVNTINPTKYNSQLVFERKTSVNIAPKSITNNTKVTFIYFAMLLNISYT